MTDSTSNILSLPGDYKVLFVKHLAMQAMQARGHGKVFRNAANQKAAFVCGVATGFNVNYLNGTMTGDALSVVDNEELLSFGFDSVNGRRGITLLSPDVISDFKDSPITVLKDTRIGYWVMSTVNEEVKSINFIGSEEGEKLVRIVMGINKIKDKRGVLSELNKNFIKNGCWSLINSLSLRTVNSILGGEKGLIELL